MEVANDNGVHKNKGKEWKGTSNNNNNGVKFGCVEFVLRVLALLQTLTAAILLALDKQTKIVPLQISPDLPPFDVPATAKYNHVSAYVYFVVVNSIACAFAAASLALTFASKGSGKSVVRFVIIVADLMMVALLFSSVGATSAIGVIGLKGNSHLQWNKVCNVFGKFCHQVMASVTLSLLGAVAFLLLVVISVSKLTKNM